MNKAPRRGLMTPQQQQTNQRHLMQARDDAFNCFDPHVELVRLLWCAVGVLSLVLFLAAKLG